MFRALILVALVLGGALTAQEKPALSPQQHYAQTVIDLGDCQQERSRYKAAVIAGLLLDAVQVKTLIESKNPDYVLDVQTFTIARKPKATP